jgi:hypothetical protein
MPEIGVATQQARQRAQANQGSAETGIKTYPGTYEEAMAARAKDQEGEPKSN